LALYWAEALANQTVDTDLKAQFETLYQTISTNEKTIVDELISVQGSEVDVKGYYFLNDDLASDAMRPSKTFNMALSSL